LIMFKVGLNIIKRVFKYPHYQQIIMRKNLDVY